ncbi:MAG: hypothetical protein ACLQIQ_08995 [Beijerinckiaceae bacterium]
MSIHIYQEWERPEEHAAFRATAGNFVTRLLVSLIFVTLVLAFSRVNVISAALAWGVFLLTALTWFVAKSRVANVKMEILKHLAPATAVIVVSRLIGTLISAYVH